MDHVPRYSVVIPAYNAEGTLPATLAALAAQSVPRGEVEVIVVDDGSRDGTAACARAAGVTCLQQPNAGPAAARNNGARAARGDLLLFTDADCIPAPTWIEEMARPFADPAVSGAQGAYRSAQTGLAPRFAQAEFEFRYTYTQRFPTLDLIATYSAAYRRTVFLEAGGFDTSFPVADNEDTEFSYRLVQAGHQLVFAPKALVQHRHQPSLRRYLRLKYRRGYWRMIVYRRYPDKAVRDRYTPALIKLETLAMAGSFAALPLGLLDLRLAALAPLAWLAILAAETPNGARLWSRDRGLALAWPVLALLRAASFAFGSLAGTARALLDSRQRA